VVCAIDSGKRGSVVDPRPPAVAGPLAVVGVGWAWSEVVGTRFLDAVALDLTDATGRAHAAWWLLMRPTADIDDARMQIDQPLIWHIINDAVYMRDCDAEALRLVVLHVAGR